MEIIEIEETKDSIYYIEDLSHKNFKLHIEVVRNSIRVIVRVASLSISELANMAKLNIKTTKRFLIEEDRTFSFGTVSNMNNLVHEIFKNSTIKEEAS